MPFPHYGKQFRRNKKGQWNDLAKQFNPNRLPPAISPSAEAQPREPGSDDEPVVIEWKYEEDKLCL